ncbi:MAG TPA: NAD-dependent epimerase/dehydratase family protein [Hyphomicrobiaceae bacterium]|nr:NAD-dependent epimerase/dehydratase family protein [Hyphomicrobiaceae bacterium]
MTPDALQGKRIVLTGAAGFIGFHLANRLLQAGAHVHGIDNLDPYYDVALKEARLAAIAPRAQFAFTRADIAEPGRLRALFSSYRPDYVVHMAAQAGVRHSLVDPGAYTHANIDGFLAVLEACRAHPVRHLLYASSSSVYGASAAVPFSESDPADRPLSLYAATKRAGELMAYSYAHLFRIPATALRFFTVYGPWGRPDMALFTFTRAILEGNPIDVFNAGRMQRDFTYIDDVAQAVVRLVPRAPDERRQGTSESGPTVPHAIFNIGNHTAIPLDRFIAAIEAALGRSAIRRNLPMQPGDVPATFADVSRLAEAVGFAPSTPIEDGVRRFVAWYRTFYGV